MVRAEEGHTVERRTCNMLTCEISNIALYLKLLPKKVKEMASWCLVCVGANWQRKDGAIATDDLHRQEVHSKINKKHTRKIIGHFLAEFPA